MDVISVLQSQALLSRANMNNMRCRIVKSHRNIMKLELFGTQLSYLVAGFL